jgi:integral membrane sensor domain MASE1
MFSTVQLLAIASVRLLYVPKYLTLPVWFETMGIFWSYAIGAIWMEPSIICPSPMRMGLRIPHSLSPQASKIGRLGELLASPCSFLTSEV